MRKFFILMLLGVFVVCSGAVYAGTFDSTLNAQETKQVGPKRGPAPNSGDGIPDGPGW